MQTLLKICIIGLFLIGIANSQFFIVQSPTSMKFIPAGDENISRDEIPGIINFLFGLPSHHLKKTESWPGLERFDIFNPPKVNVLITLYVPTGKVFTPKEFTVKYGVDGQTRESPVANLNYAVMQEDGDVQIMDLHSYKYENTKKRLSEDNSIVELTEKLSNDEESLAILTEIQMLQDIANNLARHKNRQSVHVVLIALKGLSAKYGVDSVQVKTGIKLYQHFIQEFNHIIKKKLSDEVLFEIDVVSQSLPDLSLVRHKRATSVAPAMDAINVTNANLATPNSENFAVIFNIVLWLMIAFFLAVLAASYSMWYMDPGKDNIVYRVTSQRIKSD